MVPISNIGFQHTQHNSLPPSSCLHPFSSPHYGICSSKTWSLSEKLERLYVLYCDVFLSETEYLISIQLQEGFKSNPLYFTGCLNVGGRVLTGCHTLDCIVFIGISCPRCSAPFWPKHKQHALLLFHSCPSRRKRRNGQGTADSQGWNEELSIWYLLIFQQKRRAFY